MKTPLVSVVMPVFNTAEYLRAAIESILAQTYEHFEFLIIDDGSTDESVSVIQSYDDSRIVLIENEENLGISKTRNKGMAAASGKYIAIFDSDDIAPPNRLEAQVAYLEKHPDFGLVGGNIQPIDEQGNIRGRPWVCPAPPEKIPAILLFGNYFAQPAVMVRRDVLPDICYKSEYVTAGDYELWVRMARRTKVWNLPQVMVYYRIHQSGITRRTKVTQSLTFIKNILASQLDHLQVSYTERELDIYLSMTKNSYDKSNAKLINYLKEESFIQEYNALINRLKDANDLAQYYDSHGFEEVLQEKRELLLKVYAREFFLKSERFNIKTLKSFFSSELKPYRYIDRKRKLKFIIKCLFGGMIR